MSGIASSIAAISSGLDPVGRFAFDAARLRRSTRHERSAPAERLLRVAAPRAQLAHGPAERRVLG